MAPDHRPMPQMPQMLPTLPPSPMPSGPSAPNFTPPPPTPLSGQTAWNAFQQAGYLPGYYPAYNPNYYWPVVPADYAPNYWYGQ